MTLSWLERQNSCLSRHGVGGGGCVITGLLGYANKSTDKNLCSIEVYLLATFKVISHADINGIKYVGF